MKDLHTLANFPGFRAEARDWANLSVLERADEYTRLVLLRLLAKHASSSIRH